MKKILSFFLLVTISLGCKQTFESPVSQLTKEVLAVEGFLNTGNEPTVFTLTKLQDLKDLSAPIPELKAKVFIEEENGMAVQLTDEGNGKHTLAPRTYNANKRYRLIINRNNGKQYMSDFVSVTTAPAIDNLNYKTATNGLSILLDTHGAADATRYYYWNYEETWQFMVPFPSEFFNKDKNFAKRTEDIETCYRTVKSNKLVLGTTLKLSENRIKDQEICYVDAGTGKLSIIYSILVGQHAISKEYFEYLQKLQKNTESIGSIFDEQPTQNTGNIHAVANPSEIVVGFFNAHSVQYKRMFLKSNELPSFKADVSGCEILSFFFYTPPPSHIYLYPEDNFTDSTKLVVVDYIHNQVITGTKPECGDCRVLGSLAKPSFWPY